MRHKYNIFSLISFLFICILLISCPATGGSSSSGGSSSGGSSSGSGGSSGNAQSSYNSTVLIPFAIGNTWTERLTTASPVASDSVTTTVLSIVQINGLNVYQLGNSTGNYYMINQTDGLYDFDSSLAGPRLYLKYPCAVGDSWSYNGGTTRVRDVSINITVPAGTFRCIEYYFRKDTDTGLSELYEYWSPGIGQIKREVYMAGSLFLTIELMNYTF